MDYLLGKELENIHAKLNYLISRLAPVEKPAKETKKKEEDE